jgi:hypothetical protein
MNAHESNSAIDSVFTFAWTHDEQYPHSQTTLLETYCASSYLGYYSKSCVSKHTIFIPRDTDPTEQEHGDSGSSWGGNRALHAHLMCSLGTPTKSWKARKWPLQGHDKHGAKKIRHEEGGGYPTQVCDSYVVNILASHFGYFCHKSIEKLGCMLGSIFFFPLLICAW